MDDATRELTARAEALVRTWKPRPFGIGQGRFESAAEALIDAVTPDHGCEPLVELLRIPDHDEGELVARDVVEALSLRPDAVEPLLRVILAAQADDAGRREGLAGDRAPRAFGAMAVDDLVPALLEVVAGDDEPALREEAFNQLVQVGPDVVPGLQGLREDPRLGRVAARCIEKMDEFQLLPSCGGPDAEMTIGNLVDVYREAETGDDATYALDQLAAHLDGSEWRADDPALAPVRDYVRECVDGFMDAGDDEEKQSALDELESFVGVCGDVGARMALDEIGRVPVAPGTRRLHDLAATFSSPPQPGAGESDLVAAVWRLSASELLALTRRPHYRRALESLQGLFLRLTWRPSSVRHPHGYVEQMRRFADWTRPEGLPPPAEEDPSEVSPEEEDSGEGWTHFALTVLCNEADEEMKAVAALALLGDRKALPLLRLVADDPVGGPWVDRVICWYAELAGVAGVDLATWASAPDSGAKEPLAIDAFFEGLATDEAEDAAASGATPAVAEADEQPAEPAAEPAEPAAEPMEPPGLATMDEAFGEFVRRMERESGG